MDRALILGTTAAFLTTISFLPQVIKAHKTRQTKDLSLVMYIIFSVGLMLWTIYGFLLNSAPIIVANSITLMMCSYIVYLKVKYG
jgi:MtN3 and saliva related transmembrane protein